MRWIRWAGGVGAAMLWLGAVAEAQIPSRTVYGVESNGTVRPIRTDASGNLIVAQTGGSTASLDDADATTGWAVVSNDAANIALNSDSVEGTGSLDFDKVDGAANTVYALIDKTITSTDITSLGIGTVIVQIPFKIPTLTDVTAVVLRIGTDSSNYNEYQISTTDWTANAWTVAQFVMNETSQASVGDGFDLSAITYVAVGTRFAAEDDTLANMQVDAQIAIAPLTIANIDAGVLSSIQTSSSNTSDQMDALVAAIPIDGTHDSAVPATGPHAVLESKDIDGSAWSTVNAEGDSVRWAGSREGVAAVQILNEDGSKALVQAEDAAHTSADLGVPLLAVQDATPAALAGTDGDYAPLQVNGDGALLSATIDPCSRAKTNVPINIETATTTEVIDASSGNKAYICSIFLYTGAANDFTLVEDATDACADPDAGVIGGTASSDGPNFGGEGGFTLGNGGATVAVTASTNVNVCLITSTTGPLNGNLTYVLAP